MRNLISFSCYKAALGFCLAAIKVSMLRTSALFNDIVMEEFKPNVQVLSSTI